MDYELCYLGQSEEINIKNISFSYNSNQFDWRGIASRSLDRDFDGSVPQNGMFNK